jgi:folate-binding protein YgfZ
MVSISDELANVLRIEKGIPVFGVDADESTVVPELGVSDLISYNKGCYIGQEIIARIYFRGHVAKQLKGIVFDQESGNGNFGDKELFSEDGKPAGRITSICFSPRFARRIGLAMIRYEFREAGSKLVTENDRRCQVIDVPMAKS